MVSGLHDLEYFYSHNNWDSVFIGLITNSSGYFHPPINTVGAPGGKIEPPAAVKSRILAAGIPPINTVADPLIITSTPHESPILAAGSPAIKTVGAPGGIIGVGIPLVAMLTIISVIRAAGNMLVDFGLIHF
jgi:hypothetical protein